MAKTKINVNSKETHISVNALERGLANTAGDGATDKKLDDAVKNVLKGDLPIIKDTFELIQGYTAAVAGSILGYDSMTLNKDFNTLKSQFNKSPINNIVRKTGLIDIKLGNLYNKIETNLQKSTYFQKLIANQFKSNNETLQNINTVISDYIKSVQQAKTDEKDKNSVSSQITNNENLLNLNDILAVHLEPLSDNISNIKTSVNDINNILTTASNNLKGQLDIVISGLDKEGLDNLAKLATTDVSAKSIFGNDIDLSVFVESINKINSFSKVAKKLDLSWITPELINGFGLLGNFLNSLNDVLTNVPNVGPRLWIMNKLLKEKQIVEAVKSFKKFQGFSKIDFSWITTEFVTGFKNINEFIYALDEIDIDQFVETIKKFETFSVLVGQDFDWLDDKDIINRLKVVTVISNYLALIVDKLSYSVKKHILISEFAYEIVKAWRTITDITIIVPEVINNLADLDENNIKQAIKTVELLNDLMFYVSIGVIESAFASIGIDRYIKFIKKIGDEKDSLVEAVNQLPGMKSYAKKVMSIEDVFQSLSSIAKSAAIMSVMIIPAQLGLLMTTWFLKGVTKTIKSINEAVNPEELKDGFAKIKDFAKLLLTIGGVVIFAGLIGGFLAKNIGAVLSFSIALCVFMSSVLLAVTVGTKWLKGSLEQVGKFNKLLLVSSLLLVFGAFVGEWVRDNWLNILSFTVALGAFIVAICGIYKLASKWIKGALPDTKNLMLLVVSSAAILLVGSLITKYINLSDLIAFPLILSLFITAILGVYTAASFFLPKVDKTAKNFQLIVVTSALTLIIGALFMKQDNFGWYAIAFGGIVAGFILAITCAYKLGAKGITAALNAAEKFSVLVAVSALVLIVAAKLLTDKWEYVRILAFGALLAGFVWLVTLAYASNAKDIKKALMPALGLALIVAVSGAVLIFAGKLLTLEDMIGVGLFAIILFGFTYGMIWICDSLSKKIGAIYKSIFAMAGIAIVIMLTGFAFQECAKAFNAFGGALNTLKMLGVMVLAIGVLLGIAFIAGQPELAAIIAIGELVMAGMVVIMWGTAKAMQAAAAAMNDMLEVAKKSKDFDSKSIVSLITGFLSIVGALSPLANPLVSISLGLAAGTLYSLSKAINQMAITSKNIASLNIPIYNGTKVVGYTKMTPKDFEVAAMNAKTIITTLSRAVAQAHDENPEMFETSLFGKSKFKNTVKACTGLASMLSKIARSVQDYASLNVPEYSADGKKIIRRRQLNVKDFKDAAKNVRKVIMTLGQAVISTYESAPEMFETSGGIFGFGAKSKFGKVVNACSSLGELVSDIANGIKTYADLNIPTAWNNEGKPVKFKAMTTKDFTTAADNVKTVMTTLGGAIIEAYDKSPYMFETTGGILGFGAQSKFTKVMKAYSALGGLISDISAGVKSYAYLNIPTKWNNEGKPIAFEQIADKNAFFEEASTNISKVLTTIGGAIINTFNDKKEWYESNGGIFGFGESTPFGRVIKASMGMGKMISYIAQGIKDYYSMAIPTGFDNEGKALGYTKFSAETDFEKAGHNIGLVIETIGKSIIDAYDKHKEWFDDDSWFGKGSSTSKFYRVITACSGMGRMISNIANAVRNFANLTVPAVDDKGVPIAGKKRVMKREDFKRANECIGSVIRTMGWALMKSFGEHPDWFEDKSWFSNKPENTKFGMIMAATKGMGEMISNAAQAIVNVANLRFKDAKGKEIIMTNGHIVKAGEKTQQIFEAIFNAIETTYNTHKEKGKALYDDGEIITAIKNGSANVMNAIKSSIAAINQINGLKVSVASLKRGKGNTVRDKMDAILNMLPASIEASSKSWNKENEETAQKIIDHSETYKNAYNEVATIFNTIANILQPNKVNVFKSSGGASTLRDILNAIFASTIGLKFTVAKDLSRITSSLQESSQLFMNLSDIFEELVDEIYNNKEFNKAYNIITNDANKNKLKNSLALLSESFNSIKFSWVDPNLDKNFRICLNAMHSISAIYNIFSSITNTRGFGFSQVEMKDLFTPIRSLLTNMHLEENLIENAIYFNENQNILKKTVEGIVEIESAALYVKPSAFALFPLMINAYINALQKLGGKLAENIDFEVIAKTQNQYLLIRNIVNDLVSINNAMANGGDFTSIKMFPVVAESYKRGLITMGQAYQALNEISGSSTSMFDNLFNSLYGSENQEQDVFSKALQGINSVIEKISQDSLDKFHKQTEDITDFTKAINSVDLAKVNSLTDLTDSLNQLAASMGNLDGLTEAIAVKLAAVLDKLTAELRVTKDTFATAERIQKQRNEFVNKAITRVENTMKNPLVVRVGLEETEENSTSTTSGNNKDRGTSGGGGGSTVTSPGNPVGLQTPESTSTPADNQFKNNKTTSENTSKSKKYEVNGVKTQASQNNFGNITSTIRTTVRSVFEEMIYKYNLDGNTARGNARPS